MNTDDGHMKRASMMDGGVVFARPPPEWQPERLDLSKSTVIWQLQKSLYGLKSAPKTLAGPSGEYSQKVRFCLELARHLVVVELFFLCRMMVTESHDQMDRASRTRSVESGGGRDDSPVWRQHATFLTSINMIFCWHHPPIRKSFRPPTAFRNRSFFASSEGIAAKMSDRSFSPSGLKSRATSLHPTSGDSVDPLFTSTHRVLIGGLPIISRHSVMSTSQ